MTNELKAEREAFERWARDNGYITKRLGDPPNIYFYSATRIAWEAWQARAKLDRKHTDGGDEDD